MLDDGEEQQRLQRGTPLAVPLPCPDRVLRVWLGQQELGCSK